MRKVSAILLAAGKSSRMGENKMLLPFQETSMVQHAYNQLIKSVVDEVIVVGGNGFENLKTHLKLRAVDQLVYNVNYDEGMTSSIQTGVNAAQQRNGLMICLADMPSIQSIHYSHLINVFCLEYDHNQKCIILPSVNGKMGNPAIFSNYYRKEILNHKEPNGCKSVIERNIGHLVKFDSDQTAYLTDIDTPDDYQNLINAAE